MMNIDEIIEMAWCDKTSFNDIRSFYNLNESDVSKDNIKLTTIFRKYTIC